nr:alpha/beta hydrolase [Streptomyces sp. D2-8]
MLATRRRPAACRPPHPGRQRGRVTCNDVEWPEDVNTYRRGVAEDGERYPLHGATTANITPCAFWPYTPAEPPVEIDAEGPRKVLLLPNRRDESTLRRDGKMLREKFGDPGAVFVPHRTTSNVRKGGTRSKGGPPDEPARWASHQGRRGVGVSRHTDLIPGRYQSGAVGPRSPLAPPLRRCSRDFRFGRHPSVKNLRTTP